MQQSTRIAHYHWETKGMDTIASQSTDSWVQLGWLGRCKVHSQSPVPCAICLAEGLAIQGLAHGDQRTLYVLSKSRYRLKKNTSKQVQNA